MRFYCKNSVDTSSHEYQYIIEPLEYEFLESTVKHIVDYNNFNIIVVAQFFHQFSEDKWVNDIENYCALSGHKSEFIFIKKERNNLGSFEKNEKKFCLRKNDILRSKIDKKINIIKNNSKINTYYYGELFC